MKITACTITAVRDVWPDIQRPPRRTGGSVTRKPGDKRIKRAAERYHILYLEGRLSF